MDTTNPAARLHAILAKAKSIGGPNGIELWSRVFEIPTDDARVPEIIRRLLQFNQLIEETYESLKRIEGLHDRYFRPFERIRIVPAQSFHSLGGEVATYINQVTEGDMTVLEFCAEKLEAFHLEPIIDEEDLQSILADVTTLFDEVKASAIDTELKTFILDGLESIRRGIYEFRIRGPLRLKETIAEIIGTVAVNHEIVKASEAEPLLQKFRGVFNRLAAAVAFASDSVTLLTAFTGPLLPGG